MKLKKINSLQIYRGIAAVLVVLFHATTYSQEKLSRPFLNNIFLFGYTGVDFFFVLSGFIIFYAHAKDISTHQPVMPYLTKRLIRIYPIYWFVTITKLIILLCVPTLAKSYEKQISVVVASVLLMPQSNLPLIGAAWTLSYELFFYLLFGVAIWLGGRWGFYLLGIWSLTVLGFAGAELVGMRGLPDHYLLQFLLNERNLEFVLGCLSAYLVMRGRLPYPRLIALGGAILFLAAGWYVSYGGQVPSYTLFFGIPSLLLITGSASLELQSPVRFASPLIFLGDASYSIYLTQGMVINVLALLLFELHWLTQFNLSLSVLVMVCLTVLGGSIVYQLVERPLLSLIRARRLVR
ncbi:acyltransferase [soil metagenome]